MEPWQKARDARPVVGAGPGSGRDRPRPGDERRAGIGSQGRAPRRDVRHRQTGEGARAAGPASWDAGSRCLCSMVLRPVERLVFSPKER